MVLVEEPEESAAVGEEPRSWAAAPEKLNLWAFSPVYSTILMEVSEV